MKRQIIKTRPTQPYRVARIAIAIVIIAVIVVGAWLWYGRTHVLHTGAWPRTLVLQMTALKDLPRACMNPQRPAVAI